MTIEIPLTRGLVALIDDTDESLVASFKWYARDNKLTRYAARSIRRPEGVSTLYMHRLLTGWVAVDHRNGDGLDNRRENLRQASALENAVNRSQRTHSSRFKGVTWNEARRQWRAQIQRTYLGSFASEEAAALVYDDAARQLFGEFAAFNFPRPGERPAG